jgi:hypothetical protein
MKNYFKHTIALLFVSSFAFTSCLDLTSNSTDAEASLKETVNQSRNAELPLMACDFDNRETTNIVNNKTGVVKRLRNSSDLTSDLNGGTFLIFMEGESVRYAACNLPESAMKDGMKITFSGEEKEIKPEERWMGRPIKLTSIREEDEPGDNNIQTAWVE